MFEKFEPNYKKLDILGSWNNDKIAFIKHDIYDGNEMWIIYDSEGTKIAAASDRDYAFIMARQNDLEPQSAH